MILAPKDRTVEVSNLAALGSMGRWSASFDSHEPRTRRTKMHQQESEGMNLFLPYRIYQRRKQSQVALHLKRKERL